MPSLPTGTVTFLFTDIEGSTALLQQLTNTYADTLMECRRLVRSAIQERGGQEVGTQGDAVFAAFPSAREALLAAIAAQQAILRHRWPEGAVVKVRVGLHTGEAKVAEGDYIGLDVHRAARICASAHGGQILLSDTISALVSKDLPDGVNLRDLGQYRLKDLADPHRLFQVTAADLPAGFPPIRSLDVVSNNLPRQLTSFIGREKEMPEIKRLLSQAYLVTLTGSGGAGKTRLALQVAGDLAEGYPDGVWLVEFAPITDPALVPKTVASAVNVPEQPGRDMTETLVDALRSKALLLVLDNCEHLLAACRDLTATLLRTCPQVRILATSREGLGVFGETLWRVPSLSVPDDLRHLPSPEKLVLFDAVRLFADRAMAIAPGFRITSNNAPAVAQVCHRLDGIPLAIELAAARVKVLSVEQIATRLDDRFRLLTGGSRTILPRHQTLGAAIDWSYNLLSETERVVLRRLSVFAGGWTLEAAESICAGGVVAVAGILDILTLLVDKSLVLAETQQGEARYRLLETVRQYAHDQLVEAGEEAEVRARHRNWYLALTKQAAAELFGPEDTNWINRLEIEHDNLRAALGWRTDDTEDAESELWLAAAAAQALWGIHNHWTEGLNWLESILARSVDVKSIARVRALWGAGFLAWRLGDDGKALARWDESLALAQELGDQVGIMMSGWRGHVAVRQGNFDSAIALFEESLALSRKLNDKGFSAAYLAHMGLAARRKGDYAKSVAWCEESLGTFRILGAKRWIADALRVTGHAVRLHGDLDRATALYRESLALFKEAGEQRVATESIEGLALIGSARGDAERAARLLGAAETARGAYGITTPRPEAGDEENFLTAICKRPEETAFATAWAEGRAMTLDQAVEYALAGETG